MSLHPFFQVQVGSRSITTVPPEFIQRFVHKSAFGSLSTVDFTVIDPTYSEIEELLILSDTESQPLFTRFGYLDSTGQVSGFWVQSRLMNYVPRLSARGMELTVSSLVDVQDAAVNVNTKTYSGKISSVVKQIAEDMDVDVEAEETNDDINDANPEYNGGPKEWTVQNMTLTRFIRKRLLPIATSKSGRSNYELFTTGSRTRSRKPVLHFHTKEYPDCVIRNKPTKEFTYLLGKQDQVIDFQPTYSSSLLGNVGGGQLVMRNYDPVTKQYTTQTQSVLTNPDSVSVGEGDRTTSKPTTPDDPFSDLVSQGVIMTREDSVAAAEARARNRWEVLKAASFTASLTLVGLPETTDIEANDLIKIVVLIPNQSGSAGQPYKVHWSSGLYLCTEAVHEIESQYTVQCQLQRDASSIGPEGALSAKLENRL